LTPMACERSWTLTPDSTETGPVGGGAGGRGSRRWLSWRACRCSRVGRCPPWSMTTRRRRPGGPPPPRGRSGRFGLLPPLAMALPNVLSPRGDGSAGAACSISVKTSQLRSHAHLPPQDAGERAARRRALEARDAAARVGATARLGAAGDEIAVAGREAEQFALRRPPTAARAGPQRLRAYEGSSSGCSTGMPAGTSSGSATSASTGTSGSSPLTASTSTSLASSATSSVCSASAGGGPAT